MLAYFNSTFHFAAPRLQLHPVGESATNGNKTFNERISNKHSEPFSNCFLVYQTKEVIYEKKDLWKLTTFDSTLNYQNNRIQLFLSSSFRHDRKEIYCEIAELPQIFISGFQKADLVTKKNTNERKSSFAPSISFIHFLWHTMVEFQIHHALEFYGLTHFCITNCKK